LAGIGVTGIGVDGDLAKLAFEVFEAFAFDASFVRNKADAVVFAGVRVAGIGDDLILAKLTVETVEAFA
jgi:hypothetical protein